MSGAGRARRVLAGLVPAIVLGWAVVGTGQQPIDGPTPLPPARTAAPTQGRVAGVVLVEETGAPLAYALVALSWEGAVHSARTDTAGRYEIVGVAAGPYRASVTKPGYFGATLQPTREGVRDNLVDVRPAGVTRADLSVRRALVITGTVVDDHGEPVARASVRALGATYARGRIVTSPAATAITNDLGRFRLHSLRPGWYYVVATPARMAPLRSKGGDDIVYQPIYYPGTNDFTQAARLRVTEPGVPVDVLLALHLAPEATITGIATDAKGQPLVGRGVLLKSRGGAGMLQMPLIVNGDGRFVASGLAPGTYSLTITAGDAASPQRIEHASASVTVSEGATAEVPLRTRGPVRVTGRIVSTGSVGSIDASLLRLAATPVTDADDDRSINGIVKPDLTFEVWTPPGKVRLDVAGAPLWMVKSVAGGAVGDSTVDPLDVPEEGLTRVEIAMVAATEVGGAVTNARDEPVPEAPIVIFAQDFRLRADPRFVRVIRSAKGRFQVTGLPAGRYYAVALGPAADPGIATMPDRLDTLRPWSVSLELRESERRTIDLQVAAAEP